MDPEVDISPVQPNAQESQPSQNWQVYFKQRLESPNSRQILHPYPPETQVAPLIEQAGQSLIRDLGIDSTVFNDPVNAELFLAISDSIVANEMVPGAPRDVSERRFLVNVARLIAGSKSQYNKQALASDEKDADKYISLPDTEESQKETKIATDLLAHLDPEATRELHTAFADFSEKSPFQSIRQKMGITSSANEKPFEIRVVDVSQKKPWDSETKTLGMSAWDQIIDPDGKKGSSSMYTLIDDEGKTTIFIPKESWDLIQGKEGSYKDQQLFHDIEHEYVHTQRKLRLGERQSLGNHFDELLACYLPRSSGYYDIRMVMNVLNGLTDYQLYPMLEKAAIADANAGEFYQFLSNTFGLRATLLLTATRPAGYLETPGIAEIPGVSSNPKERGTDLLDFSLTARLAIEPGAMKKYLDQIKPEFAKILLEQSGFTQIKLPGDLRLAIEQKSTLADNPNI